MENNAVFQYVLISFLIMAPLVYIAKWLESKHATERDACLLQRGAH